MTLTKKVRGRKKADSTPEKNKRKKKDNSQYGAYEANRRERFNSQLDKLREALGPDFTASTKVEIVIAALTFVERCKAEHSSLNTINLHKPRIDVETPHNQLQPPLRVKKNHGQSFANDTQALLLPKNFVTSEKINTINNTPNISIQLDENSKISPGSVAEAASLTILEGSLNESSTLVNNINNKSVSTVNKLQCQNILPHDNHVKAWQPANLPVPQLIACDGTVPIILSIPKSQIVTPLLPKLTSTSTEPVKILPKSPTKAMYLSTSAHSQTLLLQSQNVMKNLKAIKPNLSTDRQNTYNTASTTLGLQSNTSNPVNVSKPVNSMFASSLTKNQGLLKNWPSAVQTEKSCVLQNVDAKGLLVVNNMSTDGKIVATNFDLPASISNNISSTSSPIMVCTKRKLAPKNRTTTNKVVKIDQVQIGSDVPSEAPVLVIYPPLKVANTKLRPIAPKQNSVSTEAISVKTKAVSCLQEASSNKRKIDISAEEDKPNKLQKLSIPNCIDDETLVSSSSLSVNSDSICTESSDFISAMKTMKEGSTADVVTGTTKSCGVLKVDKNSENISTSPSSNGQTTICSISSNVSSCISKTIADGPENQLTESVLPYASSHVSGNISAKSSSISLIPSLLDKCQSHSKLSESVNSLSSSLSSANSESNLLTSLSSCNSQLGNFNSKLESTSSFLSTSCHATPVASIIVNDSSSFVHFNSHLISPNKLFDGSNSLLLGNTSMSSDENAVDSSQHISVPSTVSDKLVSIKAAEHASMKSVLPTCDSSHSTTEVPDFEKESATILERNATDRQSKVSIEVSTSGNNSVSTAQNSSSSSNYSITALCMSSKGRNANISEEKRGSILFSVPSDNVLASESNSTKILDAKSSINKEPSSNSSKTEAVSIETAVCKSVENLRPYVSSQNSINSNPSTAGTSLNTENTPKDPKISSNFSDMQPTRIVPSSTNTSELSSKTLSLSSYPVLSISSRLVSTVSSPSNTYVAQYLDRKIISTSVDTAPSDISTYNSAPDIAARKSDAVSSCTNSSLCSSGQISISKSSMKGSSVVSVSVLPEIISSPSLASAQSNAKSSSLLFPPFLSSSSQPSFATIPCISSSVACETVSTSSTSTTWNSSVASVSSINGKSTSIYSHTSTVPTCGQKQDEKVATLSDSTSIYPNLLLNNPPSFTFLCPTSTALAPSLRPVMCASSNLVSSNSTIYSFPSTQSYSPNFVTFVSLPLSNSTPTSFSFSLSSQPSSVATMAGTNILRNPISLQSQIGSTRPPMFSLSVFSTASPVISSTSVSSIQSTASVSSIIASSNLSSSSNNTYSLPSFISTSASRQSFSIENYHCYTSASTWSHGSANANLNYTKSPISDTASASKVILPSSFAQTSCSSVLSSNVSNRADKLIWSSIESLKAPQSCSLSSSIPLFSKSEETAIISSLSREQPLPAMGQHSLVSTSLSSAGFFIPGCSTQAALPNRNKNLKEKDRPTSTVQHCSNVSENTLKSSNPSTIEAVTLGKLSCISSLTTTTSCSTISHERTSVSEPSKVALNSECSSNYILSSSSNRKMANFTSCSLAIAGSTSTNLSYAVAPHMIASIGDKSCSTFGSPLLGPTFPAPTVTSSINPLLSVVPTTEETTTSNSHSTAYKSSTVPYLSTTPDVLLNNSSTVYSAALFKSNTPCSFPIASQMSGNLSIPSSFDFHSQSSQAPVFDSFPPLILKNDPKISILSSTSSSQASGSGDAGKSTSLDVSKISKPPASTHSTFSISQHIPGRLVSSSITTSYLEERPQRNTNLTLESKVDTINPNTSPSNSLASSIQPSISVEKHLQPTPNSTKTLPRPEKEEIIPVCSNDNVLKVSANEKQVPQSVPLLISSQSIPHVSSSTSETLPTEKVLISKSVDIPVSKTVSTVSEIGSEIDSNQFVTINSQISLTDSKSIIKSAASLASPKSGFSNSHPVVSSKSSEAERQVRVSKASTLAVASQGNEASCKNVNQTESIGQQKLDPKSKETNSILKDTSSVKALGHLPHMFPRTGNSSEKPSIQTSVVSVDSENKFHDIATINTTSQIGLFDKYHETASSTVCNKNINDHPSKSQNQASSREAIATNPQQSSHVPQAQSQIQHSQNSIQYQQRISQHQKGIQHQQQQQPQPQHQHIKQAQDLEIQQLHHQQQQHHMNLHLPGSMQHHHPHHLHHTQQLQQQQPSQQVQQHSQQQQQQQQHQQQHLMGSNLYASSGFEYSGSLYNRRHPTSPRGDTRHCYPGTASSYGKDQQLQHYQLDDHNALNDLSSSFMMDENSDDREPLTDPIRYFSVSHLVSQTSTRKQSSNSAKTDEKKTEKAAKQATGKKTESKSRGKAVSASDSRRRSPGRSNIPAQQAAMWHSSKLASGSQKTPNYSTEALLSSQNYMRSAPPPQPINQNYPIMTQNVYQYPHQMKNFSQNAAAPFGYSSAANNAGDACAPDYNFQLHQTAGPLGYASNMPYMAPTYPYQASSSSGMLTSDIMAASHPPPPPPPYPRFHEFPTDQNSFPPNPSFPFSFDTQDMCGGGGANGSGVGNTQYAAPMLDNSVLIAGSSSSSSSAHRAAGPCVPFSPLRMMDRQQSVVAGNMTPSAQFSSSLSNFNLTSIIPEIGDHNKVGTENSPVLTSTSRSVSSSSTSHSRSAAATTDASYALKLPPSQLDHNTNKPHFHPQITNSMNNFFPTHPQVGFGLNATSLPLPTSSFSCLNFQPPEHA